MYYLILHVEGYKEGIGGPCTEQDVSRMSSRLLLKYPNGVISLVDYDGQHTTCSLLFGSR